MNMQTAILLLLCSSEENINIKNLFFWIDNNGSRFIDNNGNFIIFNKA